MSRATNDLNAVRMMIGPAVMYSASTIIVFVVAIVLMLGLDARLTLIALMPLPFVSIAVHVLRRGDPPAVRGHPGPAVRPERRRPGSARRRARRAGVPAGGARNSSGSRRPTPSTCGAICVLIRLQGLFYPSMSLFLGLGALLVLWLGSREVMQQPADARRVRGVQRVPGDADLADDRLRLGHQHAAAGRGVLEADARGDGHRAAVADSPGTAAGSPPPPIRGAIEIRDLTFAYDGRPVLRDVSLTRRRRRDAGDCRADRVGQVDAHQPAAAAVRAAPGTVFIDGVDVRDIPLPALRGAIGFVPQEPFLFSETIADNIAFGVRTAPGADATGGPAVAAAAGIARLDKDVQDFPHGYDTLVGERGITLSGGQKQRTALARALATDPRILILDDALSAVDTYTEEEILSRLRGVMRQRTSIIVSHRVSTVRDADQIVVLDDGRIVERGRHDDLMALGGAYAELHRKQMLEEELDGTGARD